MRFLSFHLNFSKESVACAHRLLSVHYLNKLINNLTVYSKYETQQKIHKNLLSVQFFKTGYHLSSLMSNALLDNLTHSTKLNLTKK